MASASADWIQPVGVGAGSSGGVSGGAGLQPGAPPSPQGRRSYASFHLFSPASCSGLRRGTGRTMPHIGVVRAAVTDGRERVKWSRLPANWARDHHDIGLPRVSDIVWLLGHCRHIDL